jgi:small ligand-binding sensory domain FIST
MSARIAVGFAEAADTGYAVAEACAEAGAGLDPDPDLCVAFLGAPHLADADSALELIAAELGPKRLIGCGTGGVVATRRELEAGAGVVVWAATLPGARISAEHLEAAPGIDPDDLEIPPGSGEADLTLVLADPRSFATDALLARLERERPGMPVLGGLASAALDGNGVLLIDGEAHSGGAVVATLAGVEVLPCVSQGATPIGPEIAITGAEGNVISELAFRPAADRIAEVVAMLTEGERAQIAEGGLLIGVTIDENRPEHGRGDFLVRPIIGIDREAGALAIGEQVRVGQTIRLHVRDAASADADLRGALGERARALEPSGAAGALIFTCNGRGSGLFGDGDHDATAVDEALGAPLGGLFCAGEIGPVGGRSFLHGFTATLAIFGAGSAGAAGAQP